MVGGKKMKFKMLILSSFLFLGLLSLSSVFAAPSDNATIDITVSSVAAISLNDTDVNFASVATGENSSVFGMLVTNTGSTDITQIYAHAETLNKNTTNPRGTSTSTNWIATSFLSLSNDTSGNFYYVGNLVWNMSSTYDTSGWTFTDSAVSWGDYWHDGTSTIDLHYWDMVAGTGGRCNETDTTIRINATNGSKDMAGLTALATAGANPEWGTWIGNGPWSDLCVASHRDCKQLYVYKWDYNTTFPTCNNRNYTNGADTVTPGGTYTFRIKALVPVQVADGALTQGTLRIYGTST